MGKEIDLERIFDTEYKKHEWITHKEMAVFAMRSAVELALDMAAEDLSDSLFKPYVDRTILAIKSRIK